MSLAKIPFDKSWTLFLDRDGVINKKIDNDYVKRWEDFHFLPGVTDALKKLNSVFGKIVIVTNQQGIGKGFFTEEALEATHAKMVEEIERQGGRIDRIYFCPALHSENSENRKPNTGMGSQAIKEFPEIAPERSVIVGDSITDMQFGKTLGMCTVYISERFPEEVEEQLLIDKMYASLWEFAKTI
jgi:histidinol-phosphate phosphatase family protein